MLESITGFNRKKAVTLATANDNLNNSNYNKVTCIHSNSNLNICRLLFFSVFKSKIYKSLFLTVIQKLSKLINLRVTFYL